jgi:hypothetical protein
MLITYWRMLLEQRQKDRDAGLQAATSELNR